jgi:hypothetical protein
MLSNPSFKVIITVIVTIIYISSTLRINDIYQFTTLFFLYVITVYQIDNNGK